MNEIEEMIDKRAKKITDDAAERMRAEFKNARAEIDAYLNSLKEASKIVLPVNLLDLLSKGGTVMSKGVECEFNDTRAQVEIANIDVFYNRNPRLDKGKYRVTLIIERVE